MLLGLLYIGIAIIVSLVLIMIEMGLAVDLGIVVLFAFVLLSVIGVVTFAKGYSNPDNGKR